MGKVGGFKVWSRELPASRKVDERLRDWREVYEPQAEDTAKAQAGRCMDCGIPFCHQGCPLGNHIPDWNHHVYSGDWRAAHESLAATNNFPEFTGRLCPAPCEAACVLAINDGAVTIEQIEHEVVERGFAEGWITAKPPRNRTGHQVAVVGSGPAGLAAAAQLNSVGHRVTVYEAADRIGGLLRYGIPDFKLEKRVLDRRLDLLKDEGVQFVTHTAIGDTISWGELRQRYDAVVIAIGAGKPRGLEVPGSDLDGVVYAMRYLEAQNRIVAGGQGDKLPAGLDAAGKHVVILGGGDTGSDCLGTALRQGAAKVTQIELFPQPADERLAGNPWPQWPMVLRTSSSQEEGGERSFAMLTKELAGKDGRVTELRGVEVELVKTGGRTELRELPDRPFSLPADLVLLAMGYVSPVTESLCEQLQVELDPRGNLATTDYATSVEGVFAAGDARRGQSLIVWAIAEGREAARIVDQYLRDGESPLLPTRGRDRPFGGR